MYPEQPTKVFKSSRPNRKIFEFFEKFQLWKIYFLPNMNPEARQIWIPHKFKALIFFFEKNLTQILEILGNNQTKSHIFQKFKHYSTY